LSLNAFSVVPQSFVLLQYLTIISLGIAKNNMFQPTAALKNSFRRHENVSSHLGWVGVSTEM
jgi:hypothetical protein